MIYIILRHGKYCFLPLIGFFDADKVENITKTEQQTEKILPEETGWERVKKVFKSDDLGNLTPEANSILQVGAMSTFVGAIYGGIINSRSAYLEFMRSNEATSFKSHFEAKQKLQDAVTISFGKGAFKWGWRLTLFSMSFVGISTIIQAYKGDYGISEYVAAGAATGALYKFNMGPRGWIVGGGLGSILGLFCGGLTCGLLKVSGLSMEEARYWQNSWKENRNEYFRKGLRDYLAEEELAVIKIHNDEKGEEGKDIYSLDSNKSGKVNENNTSVK